MINYDVICSLNLFVFKVDFLSFYQRVTERNMLDVDHLDFDPSDTMFFMY